MKIIGYYRVSTKEQKLDIQRDAVRDWSKRNNHELVDEYVDEGISGATSERPALKRLFEDAKLKKFEAVVVYKLDRFGRSAGDLYKNIDFLHSNGVDFISITDNIDTSTTYGRLLFGILASFAEFERNIILERTQAGLERARKMGSRSGKPLHRPKKYIPKKELEDLYSNKKLSISSCAKYFHVNRLTIISRLKEWGLYEKKY